MIAAYLTEGVDGSNDADEQPVFIMTRSGLRILVPVFLEGGVAGLGPVASAPVPAHFDTLWAPDGLSCTQQQVDYNFVTYRVERPFDKGKFMAVASLTGGIVPENQRVWEGA